VQVPGLPVHVEGEGRVRLPVAPPATVLVDQTVIVLGGRVADPDRLDASARWGAPDACSARGG
jgi:hypothetical protein